MGVLVEYTGGDGEPAAAAAHTVALQIAALKARYLTRDDVPDDVVASERRIAEETAKAEGKPEQALPKIVEGRLDWLLQGRRAAGAAVGVRQQEDRQGAARRGRGDGYAVRPVRGWPVLEGPSAPALRHAVDCAVPTWGNRRVQDQTPR